MATIQENSNASYAKMVTESNDKTMIAGRYANDKGKEKQIFSSIKKLLNLDSQNALSFLDIGCGYGNLTDYFIALAKANNFSTTLVDIDEIITRHKKESALSDHFTLVSGNFPDNLSTPITASVDRILIYSVLHCVDEPEKLIEQAVKLLKPGGRLLVGDIPNVNKKGRFLATPAGRAFDAEYKQLPVEQVPSYQDHFDFVEKNKAQLNTQLDDDFLLAVMHKYRQQGYNVYVYEQEEGLPFSKTREDLLIVKDSF